MANEIQPDLVELRELFRGLGGGKFQLVMDDESAIAVLTIDHPERRNSVTGHMMAQMDEVLTQLESWSRVSRS
jgi:ethylmalonyl-CoA/methylmalonyl-CoA decarboxylase